MCSTGKRFNLSEICRYSACSKGRVFWYLTKDGYRRKQEGTKQNWSIIFFRAVTILCLTSRQGSPSANDPDGSFIMSSATGVNQDPNRKRQARRAQKYDVKAAKTVNETRPMDLDKGGKPLYPRKSLPVRPSLVEQGYRVISRG